MTNNADEFRRELKNTIQNTPGEFEIYTILAEEMTRRIMPIIAKQIAKAELEGKLAVATDFAETIKDDYNGWFLKSIHRELTRQLTELKGEDDE